jgi:hypothetical protein
MESPKELLRRPPQFECIVSTLLTVSAALCTKPNCQRCSRYLHDAVSLPHRTNDGFVPIKIALDVPAFGRNDRWDSEGCHTHPFGRVEMWRGDRRFGLSVSASISATFASRIRFRTPLNIKLTLSTDIHSPVVVSVWHHW